MFRGWRTIGGTERRGARYGRIVVVVDVARLGVFSVKGGEKGKNVRLLFSPDSSSRDRSARSLTYRSGSAMAKS